MASSNALQLGPLLVGSFVNWGLQGSLTLQVYIYALLYTRDPAAFKYFVYTLFTVECLQTVILSTGVFALVVDTTNDHGYSNAITLFDYGIPVICTTICAMVQIFYAWRIWVLSRRKLRILTGVVVMLALCQMTAGLCSVAGIKVSNTLGKRGIQPIHNTSSIATMIWLGGSALVNVIIAISMCILLRRSKTNHNRTNAFIARLVRLSVETGVLIASVAVLALAFDLVDFHGVLVQVSDNPPVFERQPSGWLLSEAPILVLSKLYANTALLSLNNRVYFGRETHETNVNHGIMLTSLSAPSASSYIHPLRAAEDDIQREVDSNKTSMILDV